MKLLNQVKKLILKTQLKVGNVFGNKLPAWITFRVQKNML